MMLSSDLSRGGGLTNIADTLSVTEVGPGLHDRLTSIEAVGAPISSLNRGPDLMTERLFKEIPW